jgi:hypothetical protein
LDIEEFLYKYYDINELLKIKDKFIKKSKEYGILKIKLMMNLKKKANKKAIKEIKEEDEKDWATESDEEIIETKKSQNPKKENSLETNDSENEDDVGPIVLPNGELLLENGLT